MTDKNCFITESQYLPPVQWFVQTHLYPCVSVQSDEKFIKSSNRNRCYIAGANGIIRLSIPLTKGRDQKSLTKEIQIDNTNKWQKVHWQSILSAYGKAPFFIYYRDAFEKIFQQRFNFLIDWNTELLKASYHSLSVIKELTVSAGTTKIEKTVAKDLLFPPYPQVFQERLGFIPNLSIIDLLFNIGPDAGIYIQKAAHLSFNR